MWKYMHINAKHTNITTSQLVCDEINIQKHSVSEARFYIWMPFALLAAT